ncbi:MAG: glycosyltransferase family 39 protein [Candidatus Daviesbacteria bacterium]|nr:glycosyltransferase family 39 protein [Candidatus Daviesbacteria bacterium]
MKNSTILLTIICVLFLITHLYKIGEIPPSVYWDEASIGYNAYSIAQTGKDEWGDFLPIHFRAFGEFKLPVYIYSVVAFVQLFGLNEFSVRIPAVLFSLGSIIFTFLLAKKLSGNETVGLFGAFLLAISPWFFIFSRIGFEVTAGLMFYLLGIVLFLKAENKGKFILFSIISFILSAYSYNSFRIISPLTLLALIIFEYGNLKEVSSKNKVYFLTSIILLFLAAIPILRLYVFDAGIARFQTVGEMSTLTIVNNYLSHFDPIFLFIQGDNNLRHQQAGFGQLYFPELAPIIIGLIYMFRSKFKYRWILLIIIFISPIPAAITKESPHALRSLSMVPFIHITSAMGVFYLTQFFRQKMLISLTLVTVFLIFFVNYFINFITIYPKESAGWWQFNYKKIFTDSKLQSENENKIYISDKEGQPYIFALFYLKYNPEKFREEVERNSVDMWGFSTVKSFSNFEFGDYNEK